MRTRETIRGVGAGGLLLAFGLLLVGMAPSLASAQDMDSRWLPWLGCWEAADAGQEAPMLCVRPNEEGNGVDLVTWTDGEIISTETIQTDGVPRQAQRDDCRGIEEARFSDDARRVYMSSQYTCDNGTERAATGLIAMINPMEWVDIKVVESQGQKVPWSLRYRLARSSRVAEAGMENVVADRAVAVKEARILASARLTADDLIEAAGKVDPEAVEALVVARGDPFDVNASMLTRLADAGLPPRVIDVVVAVSYPDRFAVKPGAVAVEAEAPARAAIPLSYGFGSRWSFWNPYFYDPFYSGYMGMGYGYSPYSYGYGGYYGYYRPTTVIVQPRPSVYTSGGRRVNGRGYVGSGSGSTRRAVPRSSTTGGSSSGASASAASGG